MKAPAFQFYAADYLADEKVQMLTLQEEGAYIRLLAYCWREGSIPMDRKKLSKLCKDAPEHLFDFVQDLFEQSPDDATRFIHKRLSWERKKQEEFRLKKAKAGKESGKSRRNRELSDEHMPNTCSTDVRTEDEQNRTLQSSSSSSLSSSKLTLVSMPEPEEKARKPTKQPSRIRQEFEEDWPKFWARIAKEDAFRAYEKARKLTSREALMAAVVKQGPRLLEDASRQERSVIHPATWMNKGRWSDQDAQPSLGFLPAPERGLTAKEIFERG